MIKLQISPNHDPAQAVVSAYFGAKWFSLLGAFVALVVCAWFVRRARWHFRTAFRNYRIFGQFRRPARSEFRRKQHHTRTQKSAAHALSKVKAIGPLHNPARAFGYLRSVPSAVFEELVLEELERRGLRIVRNERYTGDGGIDGRFIFQGRTILIQAKRYTNAIFEDHVAAFNIICEEQGLDGLFVHTGRTGEGARLKLRQASRVTVLSGTALMHFLAGEPVDLRFGASSKAARIRGHDPLD